MAALAVDRKYRFDVFGDSERSAKLAQSSHRRFQSGYIEPSGGGDVVDWTLVRRRSSVGATLPAWATGGPLITSIYQRALGAQFDHLHPQIQKRFGLSSAGSLASIGTGVMDEIWHGRFYTLPFLYIGTWRRIMFPESARQAPFSIENYAYVDRFGRETVTWIRRFHTKRLRRFDAYMIYSEQRKRIVDYLGTHQHLAVDIELSVDATGGLRLRSGAQRFYEGRLAFNFPMLFSGYADVCEWYDEAIQKFRIEVNVSNKLWGPLFGYRGSFEVEWRSMRPAAIPADIKPTREEQRE